MPSFADLTQEQRAPIIESVITTIYSVPSAVRPETHHDFEILMKDVNAKIVLLEDIPF